MWSRLINKYKWLLLGYLAIWLSNLVVRPRMWLTLLIFLVYLFVYILIRENARLSTFNKPIILFFKWLYFYLAFILMAYYTIANFTPLVQNKSLGFAFYTYTDVLLSAMILGISLYLVMHAFLANEVNARRVLFYAIGIALILSLVNYWEFLRHPYLNSFYPGGQGENYIERNYYFKILGVFLLLVFWIRYYRRYFVLSEYLSAIIFLFMLSNILETIHYVAYQHQFTIYLYSQYFTFLLNLLFLGMWARRLEYLHSEIGLENERYLEHFAYLNGLVAKPKASLMQKVLVRISFNYLVFTFVCILLGLMGLFLLKRINLYLMLNTVIALGTALFALYFSLSSVRRDWQKEYGYFGIGEKQQQD